MRTRQIGRRRHLGALGVVAVMASTLIAVTAGPAVAATLDPERYNSTPTAWGWYFGSSETTINNYLSANNMRLIDIEVAGTDPMLFSVSMVKNSGVYARGWSWWYGQTISSLLAKLNDGARLLDLERYTAGGVTRFAAILVNNTGSNFHNYKWYVNATPSFITGKINDFGGRIIDIDRVSSGRYDVVMLKNSGVDAKAWWYYYQRTPAQIGSLLNTHGARLVDIESDGTGTYTVVMVKSQGEYWYWHNDLSSAGVTQLQAQIGMRIYDIERYKNALGQTRYAVLLMNNLDPVATKVRQALWGPAGNAAFGFYLKRVDGSVIYGLQQNKIFEPASMIKALHHLTAMLAVKADDADVSEDINWYRRPDIPDTDIDESMNGGICAYEDNGTPITRLEETDDLSVVLSGMMKNSDNRMTDAIYNRFGKAAINATANLPGVNMTKTELYHRIGCPAAASDQPFHANELTLVDDGRLFEAVARKTSPILGTNTYRNQFYSYMATGKGTFSDIVNQEAASLGKSGVASSFYNNLKGAFKPGGYGNGAGTCDENGCTHAILRSTGGGLVSLPFKSPRIGIYYKSYVYGAFIDGLFDCGPGDDTDCQQENDALPPARAKAYQEMLRPQIRAALMTW